MKLRHVLALFSAAILLAVGVAAPAQAAGEPAFSAVTSTSYAAGSKVEITFKGNPVTGSPFTVRSNGILVAQVPFTHGEFVELTGKDRGGITLRLNVRVYDFYSPAGTVACTPTGAHIAVDQERWITATATSAGQALATGESGPKPKNLVGGVPLDPADQPGPRTVDLTWPTLPAGQAVTITATDLFYTQADVDSGLSPQTLSSTAPTTLVCPGITATVDQRTGAMISGTTVPNATVTVTHPGTGEQITTVSDANGNWLAQLSPALVNRESVAVSVRDVAGNSNQTTAQAPDLTPPTVSATIDWRNGATISGKTKPNITVTFVHPTTGKTITVASGADGTWTSALAPALTNGEFVTVTATDAAGQSATASAVAPDLTAPDLTATIDQTDGATISGKTEPNITVTFDHPSTGYTVRVTSGADGTWSSPLSPALIKGESVKVRASDASGNTADATAKAPDRTAPDVTARIDQADGLTISGKTEPNITVTFMHPTTGQKITVTSGADGTWSSPLAPALTNGETVTVTATDAAGNSATATANAPDYTAPDVTATIAQADGATISGKTEPNMTVSFVHPTTGEKIRVTSGADGTWSSPLAPALTNGETVTVTATDAAGNSATATATAPDLTAPDVTATINQADGATISGKTEPNMTVTFVHPTTGKKITVTSGADGTWSSPLAPALTNGETVTVTATDAAGNSATAKANAPDLTAPRVTATIDQSNGGTISGKTDPNTSVTFEHPTTGETVRVTSDADGNWSSPLAPTLTKGESVTVTATDAAGNSAEATAKAPVITTTPKPTDPPTKPKPTDPGTKPKPTDPGTKPPVNHTTKPPAGSTTPAHPKPGSNLAVTGSAAPTLGLAAGAIALIGGAAAIWTARRRSTRA